MQHLGDKIRKIRELKGYSQEYIAHSIGISQNAYSKLETGKTKLDFEKLSKIAVKLDIKPVNIITFDDHLICNNDIRPDNIEHFIDQILEKLMLQYESRIEHLENEIVFLRKELERR